MVRGFVAKAPRAAHHGSSPLPPVRSPSRLYAVAIACRISSSAASLAMGHTWFSCRHAWQVHDLTMRLVAVLHQHVPARC